MCIVTLLRYTLLFLASSSRANRLRWKLDHLHREEVVHAGLTVIGSEVGRAVCLLVRLVGGSSAVQWYSVRETAIGKERVA